MDYESANSAPDVRWYALFTRSRQERVASMRLQALDVPFFLPMNDEVHQWSDRKQVVSVPLFPGYLFVHIERLSKKRLHVVNAPGVVGFVGNRSGPLPIPDSEIESIRAVFTRGEKCRPHAFLKEGDRVRMVRGPLSGIEGTLLRSGAKAQLVVSINIIQRSVAVVVSEKNVEPILTGSRGTLKADPPPAVA